jgi:hypothetical protein
MLQAFISSPMCAKCHASLAFFHLAILIVSGEAQHANASGIHVYISDVGRGLTAKEWFFDTRPK